MRDIYNKIQEGETLYLISNNKTIITITKLTNEDDYNEAYYKVSSSNNHKEQQNLGSKAFINQKILETDELIEYLNNNHVEPY